MSWSIGSHKGRDVGYGVPAYCDHPGCKETIDRGLGYICGFEEPGGGDEGCGLFFCDQHGGGIQCEACSNDKPPFKPSPDHPDWMRWKLTDDSWQEWRDRNPAVVQQMLDDLAKLEGAAS